MKKILYFILTVTAVFTLASCSSKTSSSPGEAAKTYFEYVKKADFDKFLDGFYFGEGMSDEMLKLTKSVVKQAITEAGGIGSAEKDELAKLKVKVLEENIDDDKESAEVTLELTNADGNTEKAELNMRKIDGVWKIVMEM